MEWINWNGRWNENKEILIIKTVETLPKRPTATIKNIKKGSSIITGAKEKDNE